MKKLCLGLVLCGCVSVLAGCSEIGASPGNGAGEVAAESDRGTSGDKSNTNKTKQSSENDALVADVKKELAGPGSTSLEPPNAAPVTASATEPSGADTPKPANANSDGHLAPQQVARGGDGRARNITFDNVKFPMDDPKSRKFKREMLPEAIEKLSGTRVRIRGFINPSVGFDEFSNFVFVRDNQECCFGPGAALYDSMMVHMEGGELVKYTTRPITVEGVFEIKEVIGPDKKHWSVYRITATKVE